MTRNHWIAALIVAIVFAVGFWHFGPEDTVQTANETLAPSSQDHTSLGFHWILLGLFGALCMVGAGFLLYKGKDPKILLRLGAACLLITVGVNIWKAEGVSVPSLNLAGSGQSGAPAGPENAEFGQFWIRPGTEVKSYMKDGIYLKAPEGAKSNPVAVQHADTAKWIPIEEWLAGNYPDSKVARVRYDPQNPILMTRGPK